LLTGELRVGRLKHSLQTSVCGAAHHSVHFASTSQDDETGNVAHTESLGQLLFAIDVNSSNAVSGPLEPSNRRRHLATGAAPRGAEIQQNNIVGRGHG
jgi:hypothetical protein